LKAKQGEKGDSILILDTCAIISGFSSHLSDAKQFTTPEVINELPKNMIDSATQLPLLNVTSIDVVAPDEDYLRKVDKIVKSAGEVTVSITDKSLLALSLQLKDADRRPVLVSDDYALQNLAEISGIHYLPYVEKGIRKRYSWKLACPACFREYPSSFQSDICPICGTRLKRRVRKSGKADRN
jgi:rRNA maturation endonuclease Nob1